MLKKEIFGQILSLVRSPRRRDTHFAYLSLCVLENNFPRQFGGTHEVGGQKFELPQLLGQHFVYFFFGPKSFVVFPLLSFLLLPLSLYFLTGSAIVYLFILMRKQPRVDLIEPNMLLGHQCNWQQQQQLAWEVNYGLRERACVCVCVSPQKAGYN